MSQTNTFVPYSQLSPYAETPLENGYLGVYVPRAVPSEPTDSKIEVPSQYEHRPDLLAYDAYGDARLWWVFAVRNPEVIKDPIYDLKSGMSIYIPKKAELLSSLGSI